MYSALAVAQTASIEHTAISCMVKGNIPNGAAWLGDFHGHAISWRNIMVMLIYQCEGLVDGWSLAIALLAIAHLDHSKSSQLEVGYVSCFFLITFRFQKYIS